MATPGITLSGNLGERHRTINALVHEAHQKNTSPDSIPESSSLERLLKLDLASKQRNVEYILHSLKDDDMLYVSRALKSLWLLEPEYWHVINPSFLEHELFPQMRLQAVNKMRHWIQMHVRDPIRCSEFYQFYKDRDFETAAKFLWHCSSEYILFEINNVLDKITPKLLRRVSEKAPKATQIYFENLKQNPSIQKYYLDNDLKFFANVKFLLKSDPDVFFYLIENFFVFEKFSSFSSEVTKFILKYHKSKFMAKPELYTAWFLDMETLAKHLNSEEAKDLVIKLAKAEFLGSWFSYKCVEPLVKSLSKEERAAFKKLVFVDKAFGPSVNEWPYPIPVPFSPELTVPQIALFVDREIKPPKMHAMMLCSARCGDIGRHFKTLLDQLFDQYRFTSFEITLTELRKRLRAESSPRNRQHMFLVLVSKTGGREAALTTLLDLLCQHKNESAQVRAAILRSLVKRASIWRLPPEQWTRLLKWGHGLGLDGNLPDAPSSEYSEIDIEMMIRGMGMPSIPIPKHKKRMLVPDLSEAPCIEGLHAVIIRDLLANVTSDNDVWKAFLNKFSPLAEYALSSDERNCIRTRLSKRLLAEAQSHPEVATSRLHLLLDTLSAYRVRFDDFPDTLDAITTAAKRDFKSAESLLSRLYKARVGRKILMRENFEMIQTDASYVNALRHDISFLENTDRFEKLLGLENEKSKGLKHERFLRKLSLFFMEEDGLGERYRAALHLRATNTPNNKLSRPLGLLAGPTFSVLLNQFDSAPPKTHQRQFAAALRSNAHVARPTFDLKTLGWRKAGPKAIANLVATCRQKDVEKYLAVTLSWSHTLRLAVMLAKRANKEHEAYEVLASKRPAAALKAALKDFKREGDKLDMHIWHTVKHHIANMDREWHQYSITHVKSIPTVIKSEYCVLVYRACKLSSKETALRFLYHISAVIHEVDDKFIVEEIEDYLSEPFKQNAEYSRECLLYVDIMAKYLFLSTSEEMFQERFQRIGLRFFKHIEFLWKKFGGSKGGILILQPEFWNSLLLSLKYNRTFFDIKYTSCLAVLEKFTEYMNSFMPKEKCFENYAEVHLIVIYLKSVRHCLEQNPELICDDYKKQSVAVNMLGNAFGKMVAKEVEEITKEYFATIVIFYVEKLSSFLDGYYSVSAKHDKSIENFTKAMLMGMLSAKESVPVPAYILASNVYYRFWPKRNDDGINGMLSSFLENDIKELCFRDRVDVDVSRQRRNFPQRPPRFSFGEVYRRKH